MPTISYLLQMQVTLGANGAGTLSYTVPTNEELRLDKLVFVSTGNFNVTGIDVTGGFSLTNAGANNPIQNTVLGEGTNNNNRIMDFDPPILIEGGGTISIDLVDTSGAGNTVRLTAKGQREV